MFTIEEVLLLQSAVEAYNDEDRMALDYDLPTALAQSCLAKIKQYSPLTYFTKQEFTFMAMSVNFIVSTIDLMPSAQRDKKLYKSLLALFDRLCTLAS